MCHVPPPFAEEACSQTKAKECVLSSILSGTAEKIGSENLKKPEIAAALADAQAKAAERAELTVDQHMADLKRIRDAAMQEGKFSAAATAEVARGKVAGFYIDRLEHSGMPLVVIKDYTGRK